MSIFQRIFKAGFLNFIRGGLPSWAAISICTITLSVITAIILLQTVLNYSLSQIENKVDVAIYFNVGAPEDKILSIQDSLEQLPEVASVAYTSSDEALRIFRERHENDYPTIQALDEIGENPLGAYLSVKAKEVSQYESIANFLSSEAELAPSSDNIVYRIDYYKNEVVIEKLNDLLSGAKRLGFIITVVLVVISILITFNTIRLTIFISKEEIGVMRLVGASKARIRGAFMVEGAIYGVIAGILTLILFWPVTSWLGKNMTVFFSMNMSEYYWSNFLQIAILVLLSGILLGTISSFLATRKYLNK